MSLLMAIVVSLGLVIIPFLLSLASGASRTALVSTGFISWASLTLINWFIFFWGRPPVGLSMDAFFGGWGIWFSELLIVAIAFIAVAAWDDGFSLGILLNVVAILVVLFVGIGATITWTAPRANSLVQTVDVKEADAGAYPETDANHIVVVPVEVARVKAEAAMSSGGDNLGTYYEIIDPYLQVVDGRAYWIVPTRPKSFFNSNKVSSTSIAYVVVDAEDPRTDAQVRRKDASGKEFKMNYTVDGYFGTNLQRHIWNNGYRDALKGSWVFEVNDQWQPYWTISINKRTLGTRTSVPQEMLIADPQTGKLQTYPLDMTPDWVDRVYAQDTVKAMMSWWGHWNKAAYSPIYMPPGDRYVVSEGQEPTLVITKEGHPEWQLTISAVNNKTSAVSVALFSGRTNTVRLYRVDNLPMESRVKDAILGSNSNIKKNEPTHIALHKIYGQLTWVAPLIDPAEDDSDKDRSNFQGLALLRATSTNGADVIVGQQVNDALNKYRSSLGTSAAGKPGENSSDVVAQGIVSRVGTPVTEGQFTAYYFMLAGDETHSYKMSVDPLAVDSTPEVRFIAAGAKVKLTYAETEAQTRVVTLYDDLGLKLGG